MQKKKKRANKIMYILPEDVKRRLLRRYRRRSREIVVDERFRGWAWEIPPLDPPYDYQLPLSVIASRYCESMRDIYLSYVEKVKRKTTAKMIAGGLYHWTVSTLIEHAKKALYSKGFTSGNELGIHLTQLRDQVIQSKLDSTNPPQIRDRGGAWNPRLIQKNMNWLWDFEINQIVAAVETVKSTQPYIGLDALVSSAIPVVVEQRLDGRNLGLSGHLSADAFGVEGVVLDIKTGEKRYFHRIAVTGYALVIESIHEYPVDIGCIVYCWFGDKLPPRIKYDVYTIDEPLRQEFIELRDQAMKIIEDYRDPGLPRKCYEDCPFWDDCH
ncbi:MAG: type I-A CRISPR-associated protein Cas4/Csa1 [Candidatus Lokiarchaeota archaeon]|nr:type I-A CRISPR-associated protein Cas4/Csa1 [Candidatus Lokiarchaeota archaeon]